MNINLSHSFVKKRKYTKYYEDIPLVQEILDFFKTHGDNTYSLNDLSRASNIPSYVLCKWRKKYQKNNDYFPGKLIGQSNRIFTKKEEENIADFIRHQFILPGVMMRRKHLQKVLFMLWQSMGKDNRRNKSKKIFSLHFVRDFCSRNHFSFRHMRKKKRSDINQEEVDEYITSYKEIFTEYHWSRIGNMDETPFNFVFLRGCVLAEKGTENVSAQLPDDYRKSFTVISTVSADGHKFPPIFLAQGKTTKCTNQFSEMKSDPATYELFFSPGGNTDESVMIHYLNLFHHWMNREPSALILDRYSSHVTDAVKLKAQQLNIRLVYIPTSATDQFQPLDARIFGVVKSIASSKFDDHAFDKRDAYSKSEAADLFIECWRQVSSQTVIDAWNMCEHFGEDNSMISDDNDDDSFSEYDIEEEDEEEDEAEYDSEDLVVIEEHQKEERARKGRITPPRRYIK